MFSDAPLLDLDPENRSGSGLTPAIEDRTLPPLVRFLQTPMPSLALESDVLVADQLICRT